MAIAPCLLPLEMILALSKLLHGLHFYFMNTGSLMSNAIYDSKVCGRNRVVWCGNPALEEVPRLRIAI